MLYTLTSISPWAKNERLDEKSEWKVEDFSSEKPQKFQEFLLKPLIKSVLYKLFPPFGLPYLILGIVYNDVMHPSLEFPLHEGNLSESGKFRGVRQNPKGFELSAH